MSPFRTLLAACLAAILTFDLCHGHGRLVQPSGRKSMYRLFPDQSWEPSFDNDYGANKPEGSIYRRSGDDMSVRCGGVAQGWPRRCGVCGDHPDEEEQPNMAGGTWAPINRGVAAVYTRGESIEVIVEITAPHEGSFQFDLCENNDMATRATEACFTQHLNLTVHDPDNNWTGHDWVLGQRGAGQYRLLVRLPRAVTCSQCILRWNYITGNSKQFDGHQEMFRQCSDITINPREGDADETEEVEATTDSGAFALGDDGLPSLPGDGDLPPWMDAIGDLEDGDLDLLDDDNNDSQDQLPELSVFPFPSTMNGPPPSNIESNNEIHVPETSETRDAEATESVISEMKGDSNDDNDENNDNNGEFVDGYWLTWGAWSSCSVSCDEGYRYRVRACVPAKHGGEACEGDATDAESCIDVPCPVHGGWSTWSSWGSCSASCGDGHRSRSRACNNPVAQYGGRPCAGADSENLACNAGECPDDSDQYKQIPGYKRVIGYDEEAEEDYCVMTKNNFENFHKYCYNYCVNPKYNPVQLKNDSECMKATWNYCRRCPIEDGEGSEEDEQKEATPDKITITFSDAKKEQYLKMKYKRSGQKTCCYVNKVWESYGVNAAKWCAQQECVNFQQLKPDGEWPCLDSTWTYCANCWYCH